MASLQRSVKHGLARLTASADGASKSVAARATTRLTQVSHKAPTRLIPLPKSSVHKAGAAVCALSNYGAGMLQGDSCELNIHVEKGATLGVTTQGTNRIYSQRNFRYEDVNDEMGKVCRVNMEAHIDKDSLLVLAPDPCALFAASSFVQQQVFRVHPKSSLVSVDWFSSGRYGNGERWDFDFLSSQTRLEWLNDNGDSPISAIPVFNQPESIPFLQDAITMDFRIPSRSSDPFGVATINSFASLILYGDQSTQVLRRCEAIQDVLAGRYTKIRSRGTQLPEEAHKAIGDTRSFEFLESMAGRVCLGVNRVPLDKDAKRIAHVVRFTAQTNEDIYRILHQCLLPLEHSFGMQFYKDRIHSSASEISRAAGSNPPSLQTMRQRAHGHVPEHDYTPTSAPASDKQKSPVGKEEPDAFWAAYMLADSSMPTGSFAHSAGLEAAAQLGMIHNEADVVDFVRVATRSSMQQSTPLVLAGHRLGIACSNSDNLNGDWEDDFIEKWSILNRQAHAVLAANSPACAASLDQGKSLGRVVRSWLRDHDNDGRTNSSASQILLKHLEYGGHLGPMMGIVGALLGLDEIQVCKLLGYCAARDMVSAAVRLSLAGPLASVRLLHQVRGVVQEGLEASLVAMNECRIGQNAGNGSLASDPMLASATSSPVLEAVHSCHDLLQVRLFRS